MLMVLPIIPIMALIVFMLSVSTLVRIIYKYLAKTECPIVCLGPNAAGKTTFINFLHHGEITKVYKGTNLKELKKGKTVKMGDLKFRVPDFNDVYGSELNYPNWKDAFQNAKICFYIFDISRWKEEKEYRERVDSDVSRIALWTQYIQDPTKRRILFLFNFSDKLSNYSPGEKNMELLDNIWREFYSIHERHLLKLKFGHDPILISLHPQYIENSFFIISLTVAHYIKKKDI